MTGMLWASLCGVVSAAVVTGVLSVWVFSPPRVAYVDNARLLAGFAEAARVERDLDIEEKKWQGELKRLRDSTATLVERLSKEHDHASARAQRRLQDLLAARNQEANNYRYKSRERMSKLRQDRMATVFQKINVFMAEYGKKHGYDMILGTGTGGSIMYGGTALDITDEVIEGLNERYK